MTKNDKDWIKGNFESERDWVKNNFATKHELGEMEQRIEEKAKERHNELMDLFDGLAKEAKDGEEFRLMTNHRLDKLEGVNLGTSS